VARVGRRRLRSDDVFMETRWFLPAEASPPLEIGGRCVRVVLGGDLWDESGQPGPTGKALGEGADLLVALAASPFARGVLADRLEAGRGCGCRVVYVNACGANDSLIYDGRSFVMDREGRLLALLNGFAEQVLAIELEARREVPVAGEGSRELFEALVCGVRGFAAKNQLAHAFLGLSGGIDSALVAAIAAEALGPESLTALALPGRYTDERSTRSGEELARSLGIGFEVVSLERLHGAAEVCLGEVLDGGVTDENLQARLRAVVLMAHVNRHGGFLLNTSNKTELSLGYGTLYGDTEGALCPIGDLTKLEVQELARWVRQERGVIPSFILERPPSAELRPGQVDPFDYAEVAPRLEELVQLNRTSPALRRSEHKRQQMGVILKVSEKAFGPGRMMPITRR